MGGGHQSMNTTTLGRIAALLILLAMAASAPAQDVKRVPPGPGSLTAAQPQGIGRPHSLLVYDGKLYIGATKGVAAIDEKGELLWTQELPEADGRALDVDGEHVAFSSFLISGVERGSGLTGALMWGAPSQK